jgi:signal peptidase II
MKRLLTTYAFVFFCLGMFDRITKMGALYSCMSEKVITSCLSCEIAINRGFALSVGHDSTAAFFYVSIFAALCVTLLCCVYAYTLWCSRVSIWGIGSIIIGAVSNIIDRLLYGGVIDFIVLHYRGWEFPTFNIADVMICGGIVLLMVQQKEKVPCTKVF